MLKKALVLVVIGLIFTPFIFNTVSADTGEHPFDSGTRNVPSDNSGRDGGQNRDKGRREMHMNKYSKKAVVRSRWQKEENEEKLKIAFECDKGSPEYDIDYQLKQGSKTRDFSFKIIFQELFEFTDMNGNGVFDEGDEVVSQYDLDGKKFQNIAYENVNNGYAYNTKTTDSTFALEGRGGDDFIQYQSQTINPTESKFDLKFDYNIDNKNRLGVKISIVGEMKKQLEKSTYDEEKGYSQNESWIRLKKNGYSGFISWSNMAEMEGEKVRVNASFRSQSSITGDDELSNNSDLLYLSYPQGSGIVHDPKVGVVGASLLGLPDVAGPSQDYLLKILMITVSVATVFFTTGVYMRKKY